MSELKEIPAWLEQLIEEVSDHVQAGPEGLEWVAHEEEEDDQKVWCVHMAPQVVIEDDGVEGFENISVRVNNVLEVFGGKWASEVMVDADQLGTGFEGLRRGVPNERIRLLIAYQPLDGEEEDDGDGGDELPKLPSVKAKAAQSELPN